MVDPVFVVTIVCLIVGVIGSVVPLVPSGLLSLAGVWIYVLLGNDPLGPLVVGSLTLAALFAIVVDHLGGPIAARASGASTEVTVASAIGGLVCLLVLGPVGIIVGVVGTVFLLELKGGADPDRAFKRSLYTAVGVFASSVAQFLLTLSILVGFVGVVVVG